MLYLVFVLLIGAAAQALQVFRVRSEFPWHRNRGAHYAGAHATMLFLMAVHAPHWIVAVLGVIPPVFWLLVDLWNWVLGFRKVSR